MKMQVFLRYLVALWFVSLASVYAVASQAQAPDKLVENVTEALLSDIATYREALDKAGSEAQKQALLDDFYQRLTATLEPVVDFRWIALNVMGPYRKQATSEQRRQFRDVFTRGLVETYGRGLLTYSDQEIIVFPLKDELAGKRKVVVSQEIQGADQSYPLLYSMGLNKEGSWKVINVVINGINLGSTFRNQFVQAANKYNGDIDKVIANWAVTQS